MGAALILASSMTDSADYKQKRAFFDNLLTIYGRKPVLEALLDTSINFYKLHLAENNKSGGIIEQILSLAEQRNIEIQWHNRQALSRISRNGKQDQGVAADIKIDQHQSVDEFLQRHNGPYRLLAPDNINNPQNEDMSEIPYQKRRTPDHQLKLLALCGIHNPKNLGMIIRSATAGNIDGIIIPEKGCAALSSLVIKASAGTLFKAPVIKCEKLKNALQQFKEAGFCVCTLSSRGTESLFEHTLDGHIIYVLGNESEGVSTDIFNLADKKLTIPMSNKVESLNVAVTAALIAFRKKL